MSLACERQTTWHAILPEQLLWKEWDQTVVLYQPSSGKTHFLNPLSATLLEVVATSPGSASSIAQRSAHALELDCEGEFEANVLRVLTRFEHLGLVESKVGER